MIRAFSVLTIIGLVISAGVFYLVTNNDKAPPPKAIATLVEVSPVEETMTQTSLNALGNTESIDRVDISPEISGQIAKIYFTAGSYVNKGTPLIELNNSLYKSELKVARSNCKLSEINLVRTETLNKKNLSSNQMLDNARAELEEKKSALKAKQDALDKTLLKAPFSGTLGEKKVSPGQYVRIGEALVSLNATDKLKVKYNLAENELANIHLGQAVLIKSNAYPNTTFKGHVSFISPVSNQATHMLALEAEIDNPNNALLSGLFVEVSQTLNNKTPSLLIPEEAILPTIEGQSVFVAKDNKAYLTPVTISEHKNGKVVISLGLNKSDLIVTRGQHKLKDRAHIKVVS